jgi:hypothetical protein
MAKLYPALTPELIDLIQAQAMFFVATAPRSDEGHINLSPKGLDTFRVLSPERVAYLDLTGSGNETSAHIAENGRITFMFCTFDGAPKILRIYGRGTTVLPSSAEWNEVVSQFSPQTGVRQIIVADVLTVQTSCGFGVPLYTLERQRDTLTRWAESKGETLEAYRREKNSLSLDGLPTPLSLESDHSAAGVLREPLGT